MIQDYAIYRIKTNGAIEWVDYHDGPACNLSHYVIDTYLSDSPAGERYFVIDRISGGVIRSWVVREGEKQLVTR